MPSNDAFAIPYLPESVSVDWAITVDVAYVGLGGTYYHADLLRDGVWTARIAMSTAANSKAAAESILAERCRNWIARCEERERTGNTSFQILRP